MATHFAPPTWGRPGGWYRAQKPAPNTPKRRGSMRGKADGVRGGGEGVPSSGALRWQARVAGWVGEEGALALGALMDLPRIGQPRLRKLNLGQADVLHPQAEMVQAGAVPGQPIPQRMLGGERLHQLQMSVAEIQVGQAHRAVVHHLAP